VVPAGGSWARPAGGAVVRDPHRLRARALETLVDAPVLLGQNLRTVELGGPHQLHVAADRHGAVGFGDDVAARYRRLVSEANALFGAHHYRRYHFLLSLSEHVAHFGLEHHESSDNRQRERVFLDEALRVTGAGLLPHEYVHSWNGKFRRPAGLATPDYQTPMKGDLLWIYEGLTTYLGEVLTARSGLRSADQEREAIALTGGRLDVAPGRTWRPLADTAGGGADRCTAGPASGARGARASTSTPSPS
jgi:predicted metalloprotease with PDZ domain